MTDTEKIEEELSIVNGILGDSTGDLVTDGGRESVWHRRVGSWNASATPDHSTATKSRTFDWTFRGESVQWNIEIPMDIYEYCSSRSRTSSYGVYVADPIQRPFMKTLNERFRTFAQERSLSRDEQLAATIRFVQSLSYKRDRDNTGHEAYPKYPVQTLVHGQGDCEDGSILLTSLLEEAGYEAVLLLLPQAQHMVVGVTSEKDQGAKITYNDDDYYIIETTQCGWEIGDLPPECRKSPVKVHDCEDVPILVHEWKATPIGPESVSVEIDIANIGASPAESVQANLIFERRDGNQVAQRALTNGATIDPGDSNNYDCDLALPADRTLRGQCRLGIGGRLHDESTSEWA